MGPPEGHDLGDSWEHQLLLEEMRPCVESVSIPRCLAGERAGPPEDSGGIAGYENLVRVQADPSHPEHAEVVEWLGDYQPDRVDLDAINKRLARLPKVHRPALPN